MKKLVFHISFALLLIGIAMLPLIRPLSGLPIAVVIGSFLLLFLVWKPKLDILSLAFAALGALYVGLSYTDLLVDSWSPERVESVILRQAHYVLLFPFLVVGFRTFLWVAANHFKINVIPWLFVSALLAWLLVIVDSGFEYFAPYGLGNWNSIIFGSLVLLIIQHRITNLLVFGFLAYISVADQNVILGLILAILPFLPASRHALAAIFLLPLIGIPLLPVWQDVYALDANSGVRLFFLSDALRALADSMGFGVGYGTWGISNFYDYFWFADPTGEKTNIYYISVHNSLFGLAMRLGLWIFLLYGAAVAGFWKAADGLSRDELRAALALALILSFSIAVNVAIESPTYSLGTAFLVALLDSILRRETVRHQVLASAGWRLRAPAGPRPDRAQRLRARVRVPARPPLYNS